MRLLVGVRECAVEEKSAPFYMGSVFHGGFEVVGRVLRRNLLFLGPTVSSVGVRGKSDRVAQSEYSMPEFVCRMSWVFCGCEGFFGLGLEMFVYVLGIKF